MKSRAREKMKSCIIIPGSFPVELGVVAGVDADAVTGVVAAVSGAAAALLVYHIFLPQMYHNVVNILMYHICGT